MVELSQQQGEAVSAFGSWFKTRPVKWMTRADYFLLTGHAGSGKSTILPYQVDAAGLDPDDIAFMAPTGKAAKVMTAKLRAMGVEARATTVHSAIYRPFERDPALIEIQLEKAKDDLKLMQAGSVATPSDIAIVEGRIKILAADLERAYLSDAPSFSFNPDSPLQAKKLIIIDEASMVGESMANDLLSFGVPVLAVGDPGQLPPVSEKPGLMTREADYFLSEIHRQAADNPIIWLANEVRQGKRPPIGTHGDQLRVIPKARDDVTYDLSRDVQVICGRNETRWGINRRTRELSGFGADGPREGELMIVTKNSRKRPSLVNGSQVQVVADVGMLSAGETVYKMRVKDEEGSTFDVLGLQALLEENYLGKGRATADAKRVWAAKKRDDVESIDFAAAITCHKSQGSQWKDVVVHDESYCFREDAAKWLYTSVTRASETLTVLV